MSEFAMRRRLLAALGSLCAAQVARAEPGVSAGEIVIGRASRCKAAERLRCRGRGRRQTFLAATNRAGGVNSRRITLRVLDDDNQPAKAEANARQLVRTAPSCSSVRWRAARRRR